MPKRWLSILLCILISVVAFNATSAEKSGTDYDDAFIAAAFDEYSLQSAVQMLIKKRLSVQVIIEEAQKAGYRDGQITASLYQSSLPPDTVIVNAMESHMAPRQVLKSLDDAGVSPEKVLELRSEERRVGKE